MTLLRARALADSFSRRTQVMDRQSQWLPCAASGISAIDSLAAALKLEFYF